MIFWRALARRAGGQAGRQADRQTDRQAGRQTGRQGTGRPLVGTDRMESRTRTATAQHIQHS